MKKTRHIIRVRDFDFMRAMGGTNGDDITEWFSDNDDYLSDIIENERLDSLYSSRLSGRIMNRY